MAELIIGGATIQVAPYKLREVRQAAPYIDRIAAKRQQNLEGGDRTMVRFADNIHDVLLVLSVGVRRAILSGALVDETLAFDRVAPLDQQLEALCEELEGRVGPDDVPALHDAFQRALEESGMRPAAKDPTGTAGEAIPSAVSSTESLQSSSLAVSAAETGTE